MKLRFSDGLALFGWVGIGQDWMNYSFRSFCEEKSFHNLINHLPLIDLGSLFWSLFDH